MTEEAAADERSARRGWILPLLLLVAASVLYARLALEPALPRVVPGLLERSVATESEIVRAFRAMIAALSFVLPPLMIFAVASIAWGISRLAGGRPGYSRVFTIVARASLFATAGLLVKTILVLTTDSPDPPVNLGFWIPGRTPIRAGLLALTNPFVIAAAVATARGLGALGLPPSRAALAGMTPWLLGVVLLAQSSAGGGVVPKPKSVSEGWTPFRGAAVDLRHPPALAPRAEGVAKSLDDFAVRLRTKLGLPDRRIAIDVFPTHAALEQATAEAIPVQVTGSIRGRDLLYLEMPGQSAALPPRRALEEAARYVALLLIAPESGDAPRWFIEGAAHAEAVGGSPDSDRAYLEILRRRPMLSLETLLDPPLYGTPDGPLLARGLIDHLAAHHGGWVTVDGILRDVVSGIPFRDALYERTRLTLGDLEASWQESIRSNLASVPQGTGVAPQGAADSALAPPDPRAQGS